VLRSVPDVSLVTLDVQHLFVWVIHLGTFICEKKMSVVAVEVGQKWFRIMFDDNCLFGGVEISISTAIGLITVTEMEGRKNPLSTRPES
jgi:hypothetical protein